jgi:hypothetical protein
MKCRRLKMQLIGRAADAHGWYKPHRVAMGKAED